MAEDERAKLRKYIRVVRRHDATRDISSVEVTFYNLTMLDRMKNPDLWDDLRNALRENEALHSTEALAYLSDAKEAQNGYWWFDPSTWTAEEEPEPA